MNTCPPTDQTPEALDYIDIVFDGPPSHESGRFVEVENSSGMSISFGEWVHRPDGYWALRIPSFDAFAASRADAAVEKERERCARHASSDDAHYIIVRRILSGEQP